MMMGRHFARLAFTALALFLSLPAAAQQACEAGSVTTLYRPPMRIELGAGTSYRWASYGVRSVAVGLDVPFARSWAIAGGAQILTAGQREIWLTHFESTYALTQLELGVRTRLASPTRRIAPTAHVQLYAIPRVEPGILGEGGLEIWLDPGQRWGLRLMGGAAWSPGRPVAPLADVRLLVRTRPSTY